jgi:hypothetical protein
VADAINYATESVVATERVIERDTPQYEGVLANLANRFLAGEGLLVPALVLTPILLARRRQPQTICDLIAQVTETDVKTKNQTTEPAARLDSLPDQSLAVP